MSQAVRSEGSVPAGPKPNGWGGLVPFYGGFVSVDGQCCHWGIADHDPGWMDVSIEFGVDTESGADGGTDQVDGGWLVPGPFSAARAASRVFPARVR